MERTERTVFTLRGVPQHLGRYHAQALWDFIDLVIEWAQFGEFKVGIGARSFDELLGNCGCRVVFVYWQVYDDGERRLMRPTWEVEWQACDGHGGRFYHFLLPITVISVPGDRPDERGES